jgi:outer membrane receptor protein involved in Fe transport
MMPGVSSVGEGASGFNVRGGAVDQNLVMIDHTPVFNSSHLFGLFSVFNQDLVKDVTLYKGTIPARYGGRLSSVLDVATREEVTPKITGRGGIGLISNRLTLDIPLVKEKMSVTVGGRGAFNDFLLKLVPDPQISNSSAWFYDINLKYNYNLDEKNIIRGSYYRSADQFRLPTDTAYFWGTDNLSLQWKHLFGENLVGNFTLAYSKFKYGVEGKAENMGYEWRAGIEYRNIMADFNWLYPEKHQIGFGGSIIHYFFNSGDLIPYSGSSLNPVTIEDDQAYETAIYLEDEYSISERFSMMGGLRFSYYQAVGPSTVTIYEEDQPLRPSTVVSTRSFSSGEVIKSYSGWEPRIGIRLGLSARSSIKLSWNRMYQYIHLVSNSTAVTPVDTWYPSNLYILPENADQYSIGFFRNFLENTIETSIEIFYKDIFNLLDYKDGATLLLNDFIEEELLQGRGRAYGLEFLFRKKIGRLTGWLAYTWSRTEMKMESSFEEETINFGNYYPASFDHPNNLSITTSYKFTRRWSMSANFVYMSGRPGTFPDSKYVVDHFTVAGYGERNLDRIPDYHRFDISFTLDGNLKKNKKWDGSWTFSIYNLFNRNNAYSVFFRSEFGSIPQAYKLSVLGATFPAITYNFKF